MVLHRNGPKSRHVRSSGILAERATGGPKSTMDGEISASLAAIPQKKSMSRRERGFDSTP
jgi:hypothetical protein